MIVMSKLGAISSVLMSCGEGGFYTSSASAETLSALSRYVNSSFFVLVFELLFILFSSVFTSFTLFL